MPKQKVAILTNFVYANLGYSLTGIVEDQVRMLASNGHEVHLFVCSNFQGEENLFTHDPWTKYTLHKVIPEASLLDYSSESQLSVDHKNISSKIAVVLSARLINLEIDFVFTHDWIFTGWNLPYYLAIRKLARMEELKKVAYFHWIHSMPTQDYDWWNLKDLTTRHKIVYPNKINAQSVAEAFHVPSSYVLTIPHIKDYRSYWEFHEDTYDFINTYPAVMQANIVQVYPASTDRLDAKGVGRLITMFSHFKKLGLNICLVIANQWAVSTNKEGVERREVVPLYYKRIRASGLKPGKEVIFTSEWCDAHANGLPRRILRELQLMSNVFIFPTIQESFGLVAPEAGLSGVFMVLNRSLPVMLEVGGFTGVYTEFGSFEKELMIPTTEREYFEDISKLIISRMQRDEVVCSKTFYRRKYNWTTLYNRCYAPLFAESRMW